METTSNMTANEQFSRSAMLIGDEGIEILEKSRVLIFGLGGVGSYVAEALARSGIGTLGIVDNDTISVSNINRQLYALHSTVGMDKTEVALKRIMDINPLCTVKTYNTFYLPDNTEIDFENYDYIVDAIDTVSGKFAIIENGEKYNIPVISAMGTGNKLDPTKIVVTDIYKTSVCPLARVMRAGCRKRNIKKLKVVYSTEEARKTTVKMESEDSPVRRDVPGSVCFVPAVAGFVIASEVVKDILKSKAII